MKDLNYKIEISVNGEQIFNDGFILFESDLKYPKEATVNLIRRNIVDWAGSLERLSEKIAGYGAEKY